LGTEHENATAEKKLHLVQDACKDAFAHEFVEQLPEQYFTQIGERARMLSGGVFIQSVCICPELFSTIRTPTPLRY
jgi:ABC-type multidrug transport system fused ATPase/permease subunit